MEFLPVEIIGKILSHVASARDVMIASATCKKWRRAFRDHMETLSFNLADWSMYQEFPISKLETIITQTIFQTTGLKNLCIYMGDCGEFSAASVIAWLMYTRETLRSLLYMTFTRPNVNIFERCGRQRLEVLVAGYTSITGLDPTYLHFPCLRSLTLHSVSISSWDVRVLLLLCPKLESFSLVDPQITMSDTQDVMDLMSSTLKKIYVEEVSLDRFVLEAENLEILHFKDSNIETFELVNKGNLRHLELDGVSIMELDIGEVTDNLVIVDVNALSISLPRFYQVISKASRLRRLRLWDIVVEPDDELMDLESMAMCFPRLNHLSLSYDLKDGLLQHLLRGSSLLENVVTLRLGSTTINDLFVQWIAALLERCPCLEKITIHGIVSDAKTQEECATLARFSSSVVILARKFVTVQILFDFQ